MRDLITLIESALVESAHDLWQGPGEYEFTGCKNRDVPFRSIYREFAYFEQMYGVFQPTGVELIKPMREYPVTQEEVDRVLKAFRYALNKMRRIKIGRSDFKDSYELAGYLDKRGDHPSAEDLHYAFEVGYNLFNAAPRTRLDIDGFKDTYELAHVIGKLIGKVHHFDESLDEATRDPKTCKFFAKVIDADGHEVESWPEDSEQAAHATLADRKAEYGRMHPKYLRGKTFKVVPNDTLDEETLDEAGAGPSRIVAHIDEGKPFFMISAQRAGLSPAVNKRRTELLRAQLAKLSGCTFIETAGEYQELGFDAPTPEESFFVMPRSPGANTAKFLKVGEKLRLVFDQESIIEGDGALIYIVNDDGKFEIGSAASFDPKVIRDAPGFSKIKGRQFTVIDPDTAPAATQYGARKLKRA